MVVDNFFVGADTAVGRVCTREGCADHIGGADNHGGVALTHGALLHLADQAGDIVTGAIDMSGSEANADFGQQSVMAGHQSDQAAHLVAACADAALEETVVDMPSRKFAHHTADVAGTTPDVGIDNAEFFDVCIPLHFRKEAYTHSAVRTVDVHTADRMHITE